MQKLILLVTFFLMVGQVDAQEFKVAGKVTSSEDGQGLPGVSIQIKGTTNGVITDLDGNYSLSVNTGAELVFTFLGYTSQTIAVGSKSVIDVRLDLDVKSLEEVVVVGYGTQRKRDVTGTITSLKAAEIVDKPAVNPLSVIQGKVAGVTVTNSGQAGASPTIRIRGVGSVSGTSPLYVVDGIFATNIDFLNPNDIASMEILKDASSLAMFGVQGANGVIIITTKRAKVGETTVNFSSYVGIQRVNNRIDLVDAEQFKTLYNEQLLNLASPAFDFTNYTANTDWQDLIFREALITNNSISIASGTERNTANFSLNYFKQEGVVKYDAYSRYTARLRDEYKVNNNLKIGGDLSLFHWQREPQTANINTALYAAPVYQPRDANGNWNASPSFQRAQVTNPLAMTEIYKDKNLSSGYRFVGSAFAEIKFLNNFSWKSVFYTDLGFNKSRSYNPLYEIGVGDELAQFNRITSVNQSNETFTSWQMDHTLNYSKTFGTSHDLSILAGTTSQFVGSDFIGGGRQSLSPINIPNNPDLWYLNIGTNDETRTNFGGAEEQAFLSFLFRTNYAYSGKYLLNVSYRRDGTSKFSPLQRWGNFGSVGAGWVISDEGFMSFTSKYFNLIKLKGSWGRLGNDKVGNYLYYPALNNSGTVVFGEEVYPALSPAYIANENLRWEIMVGKEIGLEAVSMDNRLNIELVYYHKVTEDILVNIPVPSTVGTASTMPVNAGSILNNGIELTLGWSDKLENTLGYSINGNLTTINNEVLSIGNDIDYSIISGPSVTKVGMPVGSFFGLIQEGIFQTEEEIANSLQTNAKPGDIRYKDANGDGVFSATDDRTFIGSPTPDFTYGLSGGLTYKNFSLDIEFQGVSGNYIYRQRSTATFAILNYEANRLERWVGPGSSTTEPIMDNTRSNNFLASTYFLDKGDYFRIRNLSLGYNLSTKLVERLKMKNGKIYINAQNLVTFTKATGYSPEVGGSAISFGVDNGVYPVPSVYTVGLNFNF